jgi:hypothetical protein
VGKSRASLIADLGLPTRSVYENADGTDAVNPPDDDENTYVTPAQIGTLYYDGFTVSTYKDTDGTETVTSVNPG